MLLAAFVRVKGGAKVEIGKNFVPEVSYKGRYFPICAHGFDHNGATAVCKALGLGDGLAEFSQDKTHSTSAMPVGKCKPGEILDKCTGGNNAFGNVNAFGHACTANKAGVVEVKCGPGPLRCPSPSLTPLLRPLAALVV